MACTGFNKWRIGRGWNGWKDAPNLGIVMMKKIGLYEGRCRRKEKPAHDVHRPWDACRLMEMKEDMIQANCLDMHCEICISFKKRAEEDSES